MIRTGSKLRWILSAYRRRADLYVGISFSALFVGLALIASAAGFLLFSPWFYLILLIPAGLAVWWLISRPGLYKLAREVEAARPGWKDRLSTAVDISKKSNPREVYSAELSRSFIEGIEERLEKTSLSLGKKKKTLAGSLGVLGVSVLVFLILGFSFSERMGFGARTVFAPRSLDLRLEALTPDTLLDPGERITVSASISSPVKLRYVYLERETEDGLKTSRVHLKDGIARKEVKIDGEENLWFHRFGRTSNEVYLGLRRPFELRNVEFTVNPPGYAEEEPRASSGLRFSALKGSMVEMKGEASAQLEGARIFMGDSVKELKIEERGFIGDFQYRGSQELTLKLESRAGNILEERIDARHRPDEVPFVQILEPGKDSDINQLMTLNLRVHALDDYGLTRAMLITEEASFPLGVKRESKEDTVFYTWDLSAFNLLPGEEMTYFVQAADNDAVSGPKWGKSRTYTLRFPEMEEMFSQVTEHGKKTEQGLSEIKERQQNLSSELARIEKKLKARNQLAPEEEERLWQLIEEQKKVLGNLDSLSAETAELLRELEKGMITDPQTLEKLSAVSSMLSELMPPELKEKLSQMAQSLRKNPGQLAKTMSQTGELSAELQTQLEQAMKVLQRFSQEQRLRELAQKAQTLARMQEALSKEANDLSPEQGAARQQRIEQGIKELASQAEELSEELEDSELAGELKEIASQMANENTQLSKSLEQSLSEGKMNRSQSQKLSQNLTNAGKQLNTMLANLQRRRMDELKREMARLTRELLLLSEEQEKLTSRVGREQDLELAGKATEFERALERKKEEVLKLASQSYKIPRDAMHNLASASRESEEFKESLIQGRQASALESGKRTQHQIDKAASSLLDAFARCSGQQCSATGLQEMLDALSKMSLSQLSINQKMGGMLPLPISAQDLTAAQRQALGELMAQQSALRREMERLSQSGGQEPGLSGMMEGIVEEMKKMERNLAEYTAPREMVERGKHIFRRLLDARNVLRKQGERRERQRELGTEWEGLASPTLPQDRGEQKAYLKKELIRFLHSDYPEEYKRLAREYLETLLEEE